MVTYGLSLVKRLLYDLTKNNLKWFNFYSNSIFLNSIEIKVFLAIVSLQTQKRPFGNLVPKGAVKNNSQPSGFQSVLKFNCFKQYELSLVEKNIEFTFLLVWKR